MTSIKGLLKPNARILLGVVWFIIAMIYIAARLINNLDLRLFDWIGWIAMFIVGAISINEGLRTKKNNS
jgi:hypothetical protein